MGIHVDFTGVQDQAEAIPKGTYPATVFDMSADTSKNGNPIVRWEFKIDDDHPVAGNRHAWLINSMQPQALWALKRTLVALGANPGDLDSKVDITPEDYLGLPCRLVIGHEMYEGVIRSRVVRVLPAGAGQESEDSFGGAAPFSEPAAHPSDLPFE